MKKYSLQSLVIFMVVALLHTKIKADQYARLQVSIGGQSILNDEECFENIPDAERGQGYGASYNDVNFDSRTEKIDPGDTLVESFPGKLSAVIHDRLNAAIQRLHTQPTTASSSAQTVTSQPVTAATEPLQRTEAMQTSSVTPAMPHCSNYSNNTHGNDSMGFSSSQEFTTSNLTYYWPMEFGSFFAFTNDMLQDGILGKALSTSGSSKKLLRNIKSICLHDLDKCENGLSVLFWLKPNDWTIGWNSYKVFTTLNGFFNGISMSLNEQNITIYYKTKKGTMYHAKFKAALIPPHRWSHLAVTWDRTNGIAVLINSTLLNFHDYEIAPNVRETGLEVFDLRTDFTIGGSISKTLLDEMKVFYARLDEKAVYQSMQKGYELLPHGDCHQIDGQLLEIQCDEADESGAMAGCCVQAKLTSYGYQINGVETCADDQGLSDKYDVVENPINPLL